MSEFVERMQAALDKRRLARTQAERDEAIREMEMLIRGSIKRSPERFDHKAAAAGRDDE